MSRPPWDDPDRGGLDSRTWLAVAIGLGVWYGWLLLFPPPEAAQVAPEGSAVVAESGEVAPAAAVAMSAPEEPPASAPVPVALCDARMVADGSVGALRDVAVDGFTARYEVNPLYSWVLSGFSGGWRPYGDEPGPAVVLGAEAQGLRVGAGPIDLAGKRSQVVGGEGGRVELAGRTAVGVAWRQVIEEQRSPEGCRIGVTVSWTNESGAPWSGDLWVGVADRFGAAASGYDQHVPPVALDDGGLEEQAEALAPGELVEPEGEVDGFGFADRYFGFLVATGQPGQPGPGSVVFSGEGEQGATAVTYRVPRALAVGESYTEAFTLFVGPKQLERLDAADPRLRGFVDFGFFAVFALALLWVLRGLYGYIGSWPASIVSLTFLVKALFFRLSQRAFESSQAMQALQPEVKALQEQLKDNPEELNRRMMQLWQERGVNPMGGCLPMFVQMPVWIALYAALWSSVELYHAGFGWLKDLTEVDPYLILPTAVTALMVGQQRMMPTSGMSPEQAQMMRWMPLVFGLFFYTLPSGLVLYMFVNTLLSILQQWYIKRNFELKPPMTAGAAG
jgi:YidC/Oxa1 family membrane protein insertase